MRGMGSRSIATFVASFYASALAETYDIVIQYGHLIDPKRATERSGREHSNARSPHALATSRGIRTASHTNL